METCLTTEHGFSNMYCTEFCGLLMYLQLQKDMLELASAHGSSRRLFHAQPGGPGPEGSLVSAEMGEYGDAGRGQEGEEMDPKTPRSGIVGGLPWTDGRRERGRVIGECCLSGLI